MEVMHSGNSLIRAAGLDALDRCLTGAIAAPDLGQQQPAAVDAALSQQQQADGSASGCGHAADVEHMLLVALEGMYKEEREPDVRLGLLRVTLHVLQRHGEALSRCVSMLAGVGCMCPCVGVICLAARVYRRRAGSVASEAAMFVCHCAVSHAENSLLTRQSTLLICINMSLLCAGVGCPY